MLKKWVIDIQKETTFCQIDHADASAFMINIKHSQKKFGRYYVIISTRNFLCFVEFFCIFSFLTLEFN